MVKTMRKKGFTILELITVIAIIALLIGMMVPGLKKVKDLANNLRQRVQLRDIELALEQWASEHNNQYPDSNVEQPAGGMITTGAHKLAEALMGRDGHGFDDLSTWDAATDEGDINIYSNMGPPTPYAQRETIYVDINQTTAFQIAQIYTATGSVYAGDYDATGASTGTAAGNNTAYVFTDIFGRKKITTPDGDSVKVGSPVLYYKAHTEYDTIHLTDHNLSVFNYDDNVDIMALGDNVESIVHPYYVAPTGYAVDFYDDLIDPHVRDATTPYNKDRFILLSAGKDGLYGTKDDIWNISGMKY